MTGAAMGGAGTVPEDGREIVRRGFDGCAERYAALRGDDVPAELDWMIDRLPPGAEVLDIGCGSGRPITARLVARGLAVTGIDLSASQVALARALLPTAEFVHADVMRHSFAQGRFAAATAFYMLFHLSPAEQQAFLDRVARWLAPGGLLALTLTETARAPYVEPYLGCPMYWSHHAIGRYEEMAAAAGFGIVRRGTVGHGYVSAYAGPEERYPILVMRRGTGPLREPVIP